MNSKNVFIRENLESMVMNPGGKIGLIREDIGRAKQESMAMTRRIFRANLESMAMNPRIFRASLESMALIWDGVTLANIGHQRRPNLLSSWPVWCPGCMGNKNIRNKRTTTCNMGS